MDFDDSRQDQWKIHFYSYHFVAFFKKQKDAPRLSLENQLALKESHRLKDLPRVSNPFRILFWHLRADMLFIKGIFAEE